MGTRSTDQALQELIATRDALKAQLQACEANVDSSLLELLEVRSADYFSVRTPAFYDALTAIDQVSSSRRSQLGQKRRLKDEISQLEFKLYYLQLDTFGLAQCFPDDLSDTAEITSRSFGFS